MRDRRFQLALLVLILVGVIGGTLMCKVSETPRNSPELHAELLTEWGETNTRERLDFCFDWIRMGSDLQTEVAIERSRELGYDEAEGLGTALPFFLSKCAHPDKLLMESA